MRMNKTGRDSLITQYESLVNVSARVLMKRYGLAGPVYDDLCSAGYLALVEAAEKSNEQTQNTFRAYAAIRIRGAMIDLLRSTTVLSRRSHQFIKAMHAMQYLREEDLLETDVLQTKNQSPRDRLARVLDMAGKGALAFQLSASELSDEIEQVPDRSLLPDEALIRNNKRAVLERLINTLPEKEQLIIREYYFNDKPFIAIARENQGMNKSWVSKLHSRALERLRDQIHDVTL